MPIASWPDVAPRLIDVATGRRPADMLIRNGRWVNVHSGEIIPNTDLAIVAGRFAAVGPDLAYAIGPETEVIDAAGRYLVPRVLFEVVRTKNRELFLMVLVLLCLGSAALTGAMGWSLALGAFLAGLALSESDYASQTLAEVLPFRDTLSSLFFVSVGMLIDPRALLDSAGLIAAISIVTIVAKVLLERQGAGRARRPALATPPILPAYRPAP